MRRNRRVVLGLFAALVCGCAQVRPPLAKVRSDPPDATTALKPVVPISKNDQIEPASTARTAQQTAGPAQTSGTSVAPQPVAGRNGSSPDCLPPLLEVPTAAPDTASESPGPLEDVAAGPLRAAAPVDDAVRRAANASPAAAVTTPAETKAETEVRARTAMKSDVSPGSRLGTTWATVGNETISQHDMQLAYDEFVKDNVPKGQHVRDEEKESILKHLLERLIDRAVILQEAKRTMLKSDKQQKAFDGFIDKEFHDHQLPMLMRKYKVKTEHDLEEKLRAEGRSVKSIKESQRVDMLSQEFVRHWLGPRLQSIGLPEMKDYYAEHVHSYDRPSQVTWREIVFKADRMAERPEARRRAEAARQRLLRGEDFGALARALSQGPTAARGGERITEPKATSVSAVNDALGALTLGQVSPVLEGRAGFYLVRVDARRPAGPAPFVEVQGEVLKALREEILQKEGNSYIEGLRKRAVVVKHVGSTDDASDVAGKPPRP
jgi:parvulin-like peptidyl-prolyl isomerase